MQAIYQNDPKPTAIKPKSRRWQVGTRMAGKVAPKLPYVQKRYTAPDDATIDELLACYGYLCERNPLWLAGFYPRNELDAAAERIRAKLKAARAGGQPGNTLVAFCSFEA